VLYYLILTLKELQEIFSHFKTRKLQLMQVMYLTQNQTTRKSRSKYSNQACAIFFYGTGTSTQGLMIAMQVWLSFELCPYPFLPWFIF
jgi:hypothetical protein